MMLKIVHEGDGNVAMSLNVEVVVEMVIDATVAGDGDGNEDIDDIT